LGGKKTRPEQKTLHRLPEPAFIMGQVFKELSRQLTERMVNIHVLLAALAAVSLFNGVTAVETGLVFAQGFLHFLVPGKNMKD
jgi:hypothetical protein